MTYPEDALSTVISTPHEVDPEGAGGAATAFAATDFARRYRRGERIGTGGMGEVHAWEDRATGREVAMKTIRADRRDAVAARRFAREARVQAQLEHPSIVPVYDVGFDRDDALYFTMKRVRGQSLASILTALRDGQDTGVYTQRKLLTVVARVAMALAYAHRRGVVNRDLKPANIMLGAFDEVYVIDWGLAAVRGEAAPAEASAPVSPAGLLAAGAALYGPLVDSSQRPETRAGQVIGTPGYLSPEQAGGAQRVDERSDVYSLGAILFEVLAGQRMHQGDTVAAILLSTLELDGTSPAERAPERNVAPELDALCRAATRVEPAARTVSAADIARGIETYLDGHRDLERRRELAAEAAARAAQAFETARAGEKEEELRAAALQEVGRALALDPDNLSARITLVRALTEPPRVAPRAAEDSYRAVALQSTRMAARNAAMALLTYALYFPFLFWMGVRNPWLLGAMSTAIAVNVATTYYYYRRPPATPTLPWPHFAVSTVALLSGVPLFGPLVLLPAIVIVNGVSYISTFGRRSVYYIIPAVLIIVVPLALQLVGVLPPSYDFSDGTIRILPGMTELPRVPALCLLVLTHVVVIAGGLGYVWRLRCNYLDVERALHGQAWQLAQLVPAELVQAASRRELDVRRGDAPASGPASLPTLPL